ncbi:CHASE3 domain-containing protein [Gemmata sp. G18]|uniref:CHASE3 domain-containing protein n=1 Tax=Gemmata palustris TaxID=2822762 RepID=A0ABS5BJ66_9BACT|nr:CHASE3 domain-containing protein [Gemmata palustris]MBP3953748.1 CHASE3 domain-containing protein [Gemmata palustris]
MHAKWTFGRLLTAGFGFAALAVLFVGIIGYSSVARLIETGRKVSRTHQVRRELSELQARLTDAETGQRGYVITGDERFLAPYVTGLEQIKVLTAQLRVLMADTSEQIRGLDRVDDHIEAKLAELKQTVEIRKRNGFDPAAKVVSAGAGKKIMDEIRVLIADLDRQEQALLRSRTAEAEFMLSRARINIWGATGTGLFVVALVGWYISSSLGRQIGSTVQHIQTSSGELQRTLHQQSTVSREQAASMSAIATAAAELVATSHHIADRAHRISEAADVTTLSARADMGQACEMPAAFHQVVQLLESTNEAVKGIERSAKHQVSAGERVSVALVGVAQSARDSSTSFEQTLRTVTELTGRSHILAMLMRPRGRKRPTSVTGTG